MTTERMATIAITISSSISVNEARGFRWNSMALF
jgi:hypothetical protein